MPSFREIKASQLASYADRLQELDARAESVYTGLDDALDALSRAQDAVSAIHAGIDKIKRERRQVERQISELNSQMDPAVMQTLPPELLLAIFREMTSITTTWNCHQQFLGPYDRDRATAPWTLSAVCTRWRHLALAASFLWTYIWLNGICPSQEALRTRLCLERSRHLPLDISVQWTQFKYSGELHDPILDILADAAHRWRSMQFAIPSYAISSSRLNIFCQRTPLLEELIVHEDLRAISNPWHDDFPQYLPDCPRLRTMDTDGCHIIWMPPRSALLSLTRLELTVQLPADVIWEMLLLAPQLEFLDLKQLDEPSEWTQGPPSQLTLQKLTHLYLYSWGVDVLTTWPGLLRLPALSTLAIMDSTCENLGVVIDAANEIRTLEISNEVEEDDIPVLAALTKLRHLIICDVGTDVSIPSAVLDEIDRTQIWPELQSIKFSGGQLSPSAAEVLLRLIHARNLPAVVDPNFSRLREVIFEDAVGPGWFTSQLLLEYDCYLSRHMKPRI